MASSTPETLAAAAACYCFDRITAEKVKLYLLAQLAGLGSMTPAQLAEAAKCFCFDPVTQKKVEAYLLSQVFSNVSATCSVGAPTSPPSGPCGIAYSLDPTPGLWVWNSTTSTWVNLLAPGP